LEFELLEQYLVEEVSFSHDSILKTHTNSVVIGLEWYFFCSRFIDADEATAGLIFETTLSIALLKHSLYN